MDNMELLTKVYKLIGEQDIEIGKLRTEQAKREVYEIELEGRCFEQMQDYVKVASTERIRKLRERVRDLERKTNDLEYLVKRQQVALELYSKKLAEVEVELDLMKKDKLDPFEIIDKMEKEANDILKKKGE